MADESKDGGHAGGDEGNPKAGAGGSRDATAVHDLVRAFVPQSPAQLMAGLAAAAAEDDDADVYGSGNSLNAFEESTAGLLGKQWGMLCVSGVMAQLIAMQVHCKATGRSVIALHRTSHLLNHEHDAYRELLGLQAVVIGDPCKPLSADAVKGIASPGEVGAVVVELPQRENGGATTSWSDLLAMRKWADRHDVALHLDGARLWEVQPYYNKSYAEICALFDTVYVSFYKGLGGMVGAMLCGNEPLGRQAFTWLRRFGGNIYTQLPIMLSARACLRNRKDTFPDRFAKIKRVVASIRSAVDAAAAAGEGAPVWFVPEVPQSCLVHTYFGRAPAEVVLEAAAQVEESHGIRVVTRCRPARFTPPAVAAAAGADGDDLPPAGILQPFSYTEWNMGVENMRIPDDVFVKGWLAFVQALQAILKREAAAGAAAEGAA